jgi:hypothetical protein
MELRKYIKEMVEVKLNEMAAIASLERIKSPEKLEKFKKLYGGNENSLISKVIETIEKGSVKIIDDTKAESDPKAQELVKFIRNFNSKPGFQNHPIPIVLLNKEFGDINSFINDGILKKVEGATRNGIVVTTNKSHTAGISPVLHDLTKAGVLFNPKEEGEYIVPKKEKPESSSSSRNFKDALKKAMSDLESLEDDDSTEDKNPLNEEFKRMQELAGFKFN